MGGVLLALWAVSAGAQTAPDGDAAAARTAEFPLDLPAAIERALLGNRTLRQAELNIRAGALEVQRADAAFDLRLIPSGAVSGGEAVDTTTYGLTLAKRVRWGGDVSVGGSYSRLEVDGAPDTHAARVGVRLDQPLFRGAGALVQLEPLRQAEVRLLRAERALESAKADVVLAVIERYEDLRRAARQLQADTEALARLDGLARVTASRERQGRATRLDGLRVEEQRGRLRTRITAGEEDLAAQRRAFAELLGDPPDFRYELSDPPLLAPDLPAPDEALAIALSNRLDYAESLQNVRDAQRGAAIARRNRLPDLRVLARIERFDDGPRPGDAAGLDETAWLIGLGSGADLLGRGAELDHRQAGVATASALLETEAVTARIRREVLDRLGACRRAWQDDAVAAHHAGLARQRLELAGRLYALGRVDHMALADAEDAAQAAENARLAAAAEAAIAGYRLWRALGTLTDPPEALKP